ncbi:unnamed protein product [Prunus armeniaca]|uniref:Uncharacterized protein n=1 Tax=Prunus armeniaca TaxID=36596 RepID=A0A6J5VGA0_PRUAR|nr:unnamed protein product [Prunus armeniaca]
MFNNKVTLAETIEATRQFDEENVLSITRYGLVFKACYADGMVLSVRRFPDGALNENLFRKEAEEEAASFSSSGAPSPTNPSTNFQKLNKHK